MHNPLKVAALATVLSVTPALEANSAVPSNEKPGVTAGVEENSTLYLDPLTLDLTVDEATLRTLPIEEQRALLNRALATVSKVVNDCMENRSSKPKGDAYEYPPRHEAGQEPNTIKSILNSREVSAQITCDGFARRVTSCELSADSYNVVKSYVKPGTDPLATRASTITELHIACSGPNVALNTDFLNSRSTNHVPTKNKGSEATSVQITGTNATDRDATPRLSHTPREGVLRHETWVITHNDDSNTFASGTDSFYQEAVEEDGSFPLMKGAIRTLKELFRKAGMPIE